VDIKNTLRTSVAAGALLALAPVAISSSADAGSLKQQGKMDLVMGGQIARSLLYVDDGETSQLFHIDNPTTGTRVRYIAKGQLTESITVGGLLEHDVGQSNQSARFTTTTGDEESPDTATFGIRHADISFSHKSLGKLSIGQGNGAANGVSEVSLGGWGFINAGGPAQNSAFDFFNNGTQAYSGQTIGANMSQFDGNSRNDRVRYDTPSFGGLVVSASLQDNGSIETAARYGAKFGGVQVKIAAHYNNNNGGTGFQQWSTSGAAKHSSGLNVEAGYGGRSGDGLGRKPKWWKAGVGYTAKLSSLGATSFGFVYHDNEDVGTAGNDANSISIIAVQKLASIGADMGIQYQRLTLDDTANTDYDDINQVMFTTKLNF